MCIVQCKEDGRLQAALGFQSLCRLPTLMFVMPGVAVFAAGGLWMWSCDVHVCACGQL